MNKFAVLISGLALLAALSGTARAFQEYPSLEVAPYVGYLLYDSELAEYESNLSFGLRVDLRTFAMLGFQFHYARTASTADFPGQPFGADDHVDRVQLNLTRDLTLTRGFFIYGYGGVGSFSRTVGDFYEHDWSLQAGLGVRRNLIDKLYLRADGGWTGAWLSDDDPAGRFADTTLTHHFEAALTLSVLFDN